MNYKYVLTQFVFDTNDENANNNNYWYCKNRKSRSVTTSSYFHKSQLSLTINNIANYAAEGAFISGLFAFNFHKKYSVEKREFGEVNNIVEVCFSYFDSNLWPKDIIFRFFLLYDLGKPDPSHRRMKFAHSVSFVHGSLTAEFCMCYLIYLLQQKNINYIILFY